MNVRFDFLILNLLKKEEMYGFQIIKKIEDITQGECEIKTGTLYPLLQTLVANGYISVSYLPVHGRNRKVYRITESGLKYLSEQTERWIKYMTIVQKIIDL